MLGFPQMGDADPCGYRYIGRSVSSHYDVIPHVLRRRPQRSHARVTRAHQRQVYVADAIACVSGKWEK